MWYVIVRASPGRRQSAMLTFHEARARGFAGRTRSSVWSTTALVEYSKPPRTRALAGVRVDEQAQGVVGVGRQDDGVEPLDAACRRRDRDAERVARDRSTTGRRSAARHAGSAATSRST